MSNSFALMETNKETFAEIINGNKPVLVDFFATWCGPCKTQVPILKEVSSELGESARILKIDVEQNQQLSAEYNIRSIPTLVLFKNGQEKWRTSGLQMKDALVKLLKSYS